jgi:xylulokinase
LQAHAGSVRDMRVVAGVDSSTQSVKVELRDLDTGLVLAVGRGQHPPTTPPRSEQDPQSWWAALVEAFAQVREYGSSVVAVSVAGQQHGMVVLDSAGEIIRPAKLWNDTESAPEATQLIERLGPREWARRCGSVPVAAFTISKLAWLFAHEPAHAGRVATVLLPHDWLTYRLTGRFVTDRGDASGTGYFGPSQHSVGSWDIGLLAEVAPRADWASALPTVLGPWEQAGQLLPAAAEQLGLSSGIPVGAGTGDNMAAALGMGLVPGDIALSFGTSGTVYGVSLTPTADPTGSVAGFADASGNYLPLVCTLNATKVTSAIARLLGAELEEFNKLALSAPAGSGGLVLLPYLDGERTPNRPTATGLLSGLRSDVTRAELARASVEGVVCGLLDGLDALVAAGVSVSGKVLLLGGGARSEAYRQVTAGLLGRPIVVPAAEEHVAAGACVQAAAVALGIPGPEIARGWGLGGGLSTEPDEACVAQSGAIRSAYAGVRG